MIQTTLSAGGQTVSANGFQKGGRDFQAYQDLYQYHKHCLERAIVNKDLHWASVIDDGIAISQKYKELFYIAGMIAAVWEDLEKRKA